MSKSFDFKRLTRLIKIYYVVQGFLLVLLALVAFWFQTHVPSQIFINSVLRTLVVQLILFYPVYRFAAHEAKREVESCSTTLSATDLAALRKKRMIGDIVIVIWQADAPIRADDERASHLVCILACRRPLRTVSLALEEIPVGPPHAARKEGFPPTTSPKPVRPVGSAVGVGQAQHSRRVLPAEIAGGLNA